MAEPTTQASVNGVPTVLLQIRKQSGTNTVAVANSIKERLETVRAALPQGYELRIVRDEAQFIEASIAAVQEHLIVGSLLAAVVVLLFLGNLRSTIIAAVAIPTSIVATFALIWYMGFTLNMLTMLALTLSVGIVIDDAIVVLENIYRFIEEKGMPPKQAAIEATREIGLAVMATTLSLVAIFAPVGFMSGIVGRFMASFGLTMAFAVLVSLFVSFTLTPMMSAHWLKVPPKRDRRSRLEAQPAVRPARPRLHAHAASGAWPPRDCGAGHPAGAALQHPAVPVHGRDLHAAGRHLAVRHHDAGARGHQPGGNRRARQPGRGGRPQAAGSGLHARHRGRRHGRDPEHRFDLRAPARDRGSRSGPVRGDGRHPRRRPVDDRARGRPRAVQRTGGPGGGGGDIQFMLQGPDLKALERYSEALRASVGTIPGLVDVDTTLNAGKPELSVYLDRPKAADLGVAITDAADALRLLVGGDQVSTYNEGGEQYQVHLRAEDRNRGSEGAIAALPVPSSRLGIVTLDNIARLAPGDSPASISRNSRQRQVTLTANMLPGTSQAAVQQQIAEAARELGMPPEYRADFAGRSRELNRTATAFLSAIALSFIFMYLILAAQFESWLHPVTILLSLPLTLPFALISLIVFQQSLNIFSGLGLLVLFGVVKKNSILQIDHANQLREQGLNTHDAVIQASRDRLRPILMTTIAFVAGMIPLVLSQGAARRPTMHRLGGHRRTDAGPAGDAAGDAGRLFAVRRGPEATGAAPGRELAALEAADGRPDSGGVTAALERPTDAKRRIRSGRPRTAGGRGRRPRPGRTRRPAREGFVAPRP